MWRLALVFAIITASAAEAGQARTTFQVGLIITGRPNRATPAQTRISGTSPALPRSRPRVTKSQGKPSLAATGE
jgi:hypothetical protein